MCKDESSGALFFFFNTQFEMSHAASAHDLSEPLAEKSNAAPSRAKVWKNYFYFWSSAAILIAMPSG